MGLAENAKRFRAERGLTGYKLHKLSGLTPTQIKAIEDGANQNPGSEVLLKLATGLGVSVDSLLRDGSPLPSGEDHDEGRVQHTVTVPLVGVASGGAPIHSDAVEEDFELLHHVYRPGRYVIRIYGDSMWPNFYDRDLLLVEPATSVKDEQVAVLRMNGGESTIKRVFKRRRGGGYILKGDNPSFKPIEADADEVAIIARVLRVVDREVH